MKGRPAARGDDAAAQLWVELDRLRADVADLQSLRADVERLKTTIASHHVAEPPGPSDLHSLCADVEHLKATIASLHVAEPPGPSKPAGPKKLTLRGAATKIQIGRDFSSQRRSSAATRLPTSSVGELAQGAEDYGRWNMAKSKIPVIGRLTSSARMKRQRTQVHHSVMVDRDASADAASALDAGGAAAVERVSVVNVTQTEHLVQSHHTPSPVGKASMSAAQTGPGGLHVKGNPTKYEGSASRVGKESSGLRMIDEDDSAQEDRNARAPAAHSMSEQSGRSSQPPFLPPISHEHHRAGSSTNSIGRVHRNSLHSRPPAPLLNQPGAPMSELSTPNPEEGDLTDVEDGRDEGEEKGGPAMTVERPSFKKKQSMWQEDDSWVKHTQNAYGAFAHVAMQSGILKAMEMCGPMLLASITIQTVFAAQLLNNHWTDMV